MTILDMHLEINQSLQKVAANKTRKYLSEEIDWVLRKVEGRFIQSKLRPRKGGAFSIDQLDLDAIRPILVNTIREAYVDTSRSRRYECPLPMDYAYLISDSAYVSDRCGMTSEPTELTVYTYLTWIKQLRTTKANAPYYATYSLTVGGKTVSIPSSLPYTNTYIGFQRKEDVQFLTGWMTHTMQSILTSGEFGFERYGSKYKANHYLSVATSVPGVSNNIDGNTGIVTVSETLTRKQHVEVAGAEYTANRLENSETIPSLLGIAFYSPRAQSPISELRGNSLYIYTDSNFTVNRCEITYIRKPRPMSLALGSDCELAPEFHPTLCDLAVEYIKARLENGQGLQIAENDIEKRIIL